MGSVLCFLPLAYLIAVWGLFFIYWLMPMERSAWMGYKNDYYNYGYSNYPIFNAWWIEGSYMDRRNIQGFILICGALICMLIFAVRYAGGSQTDVLYCDGRQ